MGGIFRRKQASVAPAGQRGRHLQTWLKIFSNLRTWQLVLILIPLLFVAATFLRLDHIQMVKLRSAVLDADQSENDAKIAASLEELKKFTFSHIVVNVISENGIERITFGTGPFYLEHQYTRKATAELARAEKAASGDHNNPNGNVFAKAMAVCKPLAIQNGWAWNSQSYLTCMTSEIAKYPTSERLENNLAANIPSTELYRHNYSSPIWAPSLAGFTLLICALLGLFIFIRILIWCVLASALIFVKNF